MGSGVFVGPRAVFATRNHVLGDSSRRAGPNIDQPIFIGSGCWVGAGAIVLGNVNVAPGCVIAAGAVITKDTEPNGLYAGVPALRIKDLPSKPGGAELRLASVSDMER
ncbi:acyltransferase [Pseudarthrobacter sp. NPDC092200]|uniref:acyltransferase n=1 Tax=unclassified Pseudarthrobacter TaxID=2647000 RepID=UPI003809A023